MSDLTDIVEPGIAGLDLSDLNEHLHRAAAHSLDLTVSASTIEQFDAETAIVVERLAVP